MIHKEKIEISDNLLKEMLDWIKNERIIDPTGRGSGHPTGSQHTIKPDQKQFLSLFNMIRGIIKQNTGRKFFMPDIWVNYLPPNGKNGKHKHINVDIGGCFYLVVPENSGTIEFETGEAILPEVGDLLYWNADKIHWVNENMGNDDRISIAFNVKFL